MKVGILGTGNIGRTLARKLSAAGYEIEVANSRGPETIPAEVTEFGARAVTSKEAVADAHVVILSIPLGSIVAIAPLLQGLPADTVIIDTSNYYPQRDGSKLVKLKANGFPSN
jgi:predicted dinucleotide-binding enzyme